MPKFIHLRVHTEHSLVDGMFSCRNLMAALAQDGAQGVAITDEGNLFAVVKFFKAAIAAGVKPIIGADLLIKEGNVVSRCALLCQTEEGYHNLIQLVSRGYTQFQEGGVPYVRYAWLAELNAGLIALSCGREGDIGQALLVKDAKKVTRYCQFWKTHFPNRFYVELQRTDRENEQLYNRLAVDFAKQNELPVVATNDVRFLNEEDFDAHEARVCIQTGEILQDTRRTKKYSRSQTLRSEEEMCALFSDIPEALENTVEIYKRCNVRLSLGETFLPAFFVPEGMTQAEYLIDLSYTKLNARLPKLVPQDTANRVDVCEIYQARLKRELSVINEMGFPGYFLIVADFIDWAKNNEVPVGPGRGSGAGSLVAYVLGITDLDPLAYELLFERFLNPERVSMPDFDIDFCMDGRDRVIDYVADKYGRNSVSQIITFGTMAAKAVVRDVGRVLGFGYGFVDKIAKLIPFEIGMTLKKALEDEPLLLERYQKEEDVATVIDLGLKLEGVARNAGKHAGGVVISPSLLTDFTALYCEEGGGSLVTQLDKDDVEACGLVKFDFLGLRTLTIIKWTVDAINKNRQTSGDVSLDLHDIPIADKKTFELLKGGTTSAVFQLESRGMKDLILRLQPDDFEEIIALVALFRPGPLQSGMVDDFIDRKHGRSAVQYPHPDLEPILKPTYGVILYQEQVMQIAQVLAGYTLGGADILRRAMGKKKPEEMAKQRQIFEKGALARGVDEGCATRIFDLMEKFAGYGFNKSHSAAYALISYQTAWLKSHYPAEFMAAVLSSDMDNTDKVVLMVEECAPVGLSVLYPDVNRSAYKFTVLGKNEINYGLGAIKGVGEGAAEHIVAERETNGPYQDLFNFCRRVNLHKVNKRVLEAFVKSGTFDSLHPDKEGGRASLLVSLEIAVKAAEQYNRDCESKQGDLFGGGGVVSPISADYRSAIAWDFSTRLNFENEVLGMYVTGHPMDPYAKEFLHFTSGALQSLVLGEKKSILIAGLVRAIRPVFTKRGDKMAFMRLEDKTGYQELAIFPETYANNREIIVKNQLLVIEAEVSEDSGSGGYRVNAKGLYTVEQAREIYAKRIQINFCLKNLKSDPMDEIKALLAKNKGACPVVIAYNNESAKGKLLLGPEWRVKPSDDLVNNLNLIFENSDEKIVEILYD
jgi:DNA polymerase-3 subunit alpha